MPYFFEFFSEFFRGAGYTWKGISTFYREKSLWKYALIPFVIILLFDFAALFFGWKCGNFFWEESAQWCAAVPNWLRNIAGGLLFVVVLVTWLLFFLSSISLLFEWLGGYFFDSMVTAFEKSRFGYLPPPHKIASDFFFAWKSILWECGTFLRLCLLLIVGIFFPVAGQILLILLIGRRMGISYLNSTASNHHWSIEEMKKRADLHPAAFMGYGVGCYLILLIPFAALFVLPGLCIGGNLLCREKFQEWK